jgi:hypothetical protein
MSAENDLRYLEVLVEILEKQNSSLNTICSLLKDIKGYLEEDKKLKAMHPINQMERR